EKKPETATRNKYKASTRPAMVDACSGNNGVPDHITVIRVLGFSGSRFSSSRFSVLGSGFLVLGSWFAFPADDHENERAERENRGGAGQTHHPHDHEPVAAVHRVVVVAIQQQRV